jgi:hypothetical protein
VQWEKILLRAAALALKVPLVPVEFAVLPEMKAPRAFPAPTAVPAPSARWGRWDFPEKLALMEFRACKEFKDCREFKACQGPME